MFSEEQIRQELLKKMVEELGYPPSLLVIEKELKDLPHLQGSSSPFPKRRLDILVYTKKENLQPLLLIECKFSTKDRSNALKQVLGYNYFVKAPFIGLVDNGGFFLLAQQKQAKIQEGLPSYSLLLEQLRSFC